MSSKTIKVNPDFFSLSRSKVKSKKNTTRAKRDKLKKEMSLIKPNKAKKRLLEKIKQHQRLKREQQQREIEKQKETIVTPEQFKNNDKETTFSSELMESMKYLDDVIKKHKNDKNKSSVNQQTHIRNHNNKNSNIKPNIVGGLSTGIQHNSNQVQSSNQVQNIVQQPNMNINLHNHNPNMIMNTNHNNTNLHTTIKREPIRKDPPYGILKGGKKPTFRQYHTLKNRHQEYNNIQPELSKILQNQTNPDINKERREKLNRIKQKAQQQQQTFKIHNNLQKNARLKRFKVKKTTRTYKIGKDKQKRCVNVLLKNNLTKKKVNHDIDILRKTSIIEIKKYLRTKNLIKYSSKTPEYVLRSIYINAMLCGDIENTNKSNLIYNYLHEDKE